jgi:hypothetical protein
VVDQIAVVTFTTPAAPGTLDVTSPLITEAFSCAILIYSHATAEDSNQSGGVLGVGFVSTEAGDSASTDASSTTSLQDARTTTTQAFQDESGGGTGTSIRSSNPGVSVEVIAVFSAAVAGGVKLNFTTTTVQVKCTAILFAGLSRSCVGNCTFTDVAPSHEDVGNSGVGFFQPDLLVFLSSDTSVNAAVNNGQPKIGFAIRLPSLQQISAYLNIDRASDPTAADGYYRTDAASSAFTGDRIVQMDRFALTSFDSTGFNAQAANLTGGTESPQANYLAIKWDDSARVRMAIAHLSAAAATGLQAFNSFGFTPDVIFGMAHLMVTADTIDSTTTRTCSAGYFVSGRSGSYAISAHHDRGHTIDAGNPSDANSRQGAHALLLLDSTGAVVQQAEWVGASGSGGFVLDFSNASQAVTLTALGIQFIPSPPPFRELARQREKRRMRQRRAVRALIGIHRAIFVPFQNVWATWARQRAARMMRRRPGPGAGVEPVTIGAEVEEGSGRITSPGATRGRVAGAGAIGRVASAGALRGLVIGPGTEQPDRIDLP